MAPPPSVVDVMLATRLARNAGSQRPEQRRRDGARTPVQPSVDPRIVRGAARSPDPRSRRCASHEPCMKSHGRGEIDMANRAGRPITRRDAREHGPREAGAARSGRRL